jgi:DNA-binding CsgD family transcriptional regulator
LGKTAVLSAAAAMASDDGVRAVPARGSPRERELQFAVAEQLLGEPTWLSLDRAVGSDADPRHRRHRIFAQALTQVRAWAGAGTMLLLLDDLHWADVDSLDLVGFLVRRLSALPVGVVAALRPWPPAALAMADASAVEDNVERVALTELSREGAARLMADQVGAAVGPELAQRAWALAGGNPVLAQEAARIIRTEGALPDLGSEGSPPRRALLLSALAGLPPQALLCARAAAVVGRTARLDALRGVSGLDEEAFAAAHDTLLAAGVLAAADDTLVEFRHELIADALYDDISLAERQLLHRRAFAFHLSVRDGDAAAPHAIAADMVGDERAVSVLMEAGARALRGGAIETGVELMAAAAQLAGPKPPADLISTQADALFLVGRPAEAAGLYRSILERGPNGESAGVALKMARAEVYAGDLDAGALGFARLLERAGELGPALAPTILERCHALWERDGPGRAREVLEADIAQHSEIADVALVSATRRFMQLQTGDPGGLAEIESSAERVRKHLAGPPEDALSSFTFLTMVIVAWGMIGRYQEALDLIDEVFNWSRSNGQLRLLGPLWIARLGILLHQGKLPTLVTEAEDVEEQLDLDALLAPHVWLFRARALVWQGRIAEADELCRRIQGSPGNHVWFARCNLANAQAEVLLGSGRVVEASDAYRKLEQAIDQSGAGLPNWPEWAADAVESHVAARRFDDVTRIAARLECQAQRLGGSHWACMISAGGRAEEAAVAGNVADADELFRRALALPCTWPLERARIQVRYGEWLRRQHDDLGARHQLAEAARTAERCGAVPLFERAAAELNAAGGRRRRRHEEPARLTTQQARAIELAVTGATVREIAAEMHLSPRTVESHLAHAYDKLGVGSKQELRGRQVRTGLIERLDSGLET